MGRLIKWQYIIATIIYSYVTACGVENCDVCTEDNGEDVCTICAIGYMLEAGVCIGRYNTDVCSMCATVYMLDAALGKSCRFSPSYLT